MPDSGALYAQTRERITALVRDLDDDAASITVPACPEWTIKDVVAHLSGVCVDILEGRLEGVATDPWTARQVDERRDRTIREIVDEWTEAAPKVEAIAAQFPNGADVQWMADCLTHEHDIRGALRRPGGRNSEAVAVAMAFLAAAVGGGLAIGGDEGDGSTAFRVVTREGDDLVVGGGEPGATVRTTRFEILRALTGRRSESQIAAMDWDGNHSAYLGSFSRGPFTIASATIEE